MDKPQRHSARTREVPDVAGWATTRVHPAIRREAIKTLSTSVLPGLLWLGLSASAWAAEAGEKGIDFRRDVFIRGQDGYHTYRIPAMVVTSKGTVLLFCEGRKRSRKDSGDVDLLLKRSEDGGKTWVAGGLVPYVSELRHGECTVVERSDGSLLMNMRTGGPQAYAIGYRSVSISADCGATWSKPVLDANLPCPACQASMIRLNDREILFLNPAVHRKGGFHLWSRRNLTLRVSRDEGRTWPHARVLNEGLAGYSDMAVTKEGKVLCVFENGTKDYCERISIVQVDRAWLVADGNAPSPRPTRQWRLPLVDGQISCRTVDVIVHGRVCCGAASSSRT